MSDTDPSAPIRATRYWHEAMTLEEDFETSQRRTAALLAAANALLDDAAREHAWFIARGGQS